MRNITYAYLGPEEAPGHFAKKGTASDIVLYNAKQGDHHLNLVAPVRYPERVQGLLASLDMADRIILHPTAVDRSLGETIVGAELFGKREGLLRSQDLAVLAQVQKILASTSLKGLATADGPDGVVREALYAHAAPVVEGAVLLPSDHAFPVKGIGTVILGLVRRGRVKRHQKLQVYPSDDVIEVRSIQVHDVEQEEAPAGSRVGLAVKGVEPDDVRRGRVLAEPGSLRVSPAEQPLKLRVNVNPHSKWSPRAGTTLHLYHVLQDVVVRVDAVDGSPPALVLSARLDGPLTRVPGQPMVLVDLDNKTQRFVGTAELPE
jgi:selenocysteine-specific translation elongation factor